MKDPLVSIIIPAYNCRQYIDRCLNSIFNQTYNKIEVVIVDDGSIDDTLSIVKSYQKNDKRIKLFTQQHKGPNIARKKGVNAATGDYIMFVDADDFIEKEAITKLLSYTEKYKVDAVHFNGRHYPSNRQMSTSKFCAKNHLVVMGYKEIEKTLLTTYNLNSLCLHIYKSELIRNVHAFDSNITYGEDFLANLKILTKAKSLLIVNDVLYYYYDNPNSTTRDKDKARLLSNFSDRACISNYAIQYAQDNITDKAITNQVIYAQIKMVRDSLVNFINIRKYQKSDFLKDVESSIPKKLFRQIDPLRIEKYRKTQGLIERVKNEKIVKAILTHNYQDQWSWLQLWRGVFKIRSYLAEGLRRKRNEA